MLDIIPQPQIIRTVSDRYFNPALITTLRIISNSAEVKIIKALKSILPDVQIEYDIDSRYEGILLSSGTDISLQHKTHLFDAIEGKKESYILKLKDNTLVLYGEYATGIFCGIQTLGQLLKNHTEIPELEIADWPDIEMRCMYLDLRMLFPGFETLISYIREMATFKTNTLIIEYEDKFPFGKYEFLRHREYAFNDEQLECIKETARDNFIEIIPLQQSFGHLEYVLKHDDFKHLRETPVDIGELCPSRPGSLELARCLISEMADRHPESRYVHLGCDEVWSLCKCNECKERNNTSKGITFISFVNKLIEYACCKEKRPVIWHDMLLKCSDEELRELDIRVTVMIWLYDGNNIQKQVRQLVDKFQTYGIEVMGAPSVRCRDRKDNQNYPDAPKRVSNILQWVNAALECKLTCLVSTNWAAAFGMGCPYGIFETSLYLMYLTADEYWNASSDTKSFLKRFLKTFHGLIYTEDYEEFELCNVEDYYGLIGSLVPRLKKNREIAELIEIMNEFENIVEGCFSADKYLYRINLFGEQEVERISFDAKYRHMVEGLENLRPRMEEILRSFLSESMVQIYMTSRFYLQDLQKELIYKEIYV